MSAAPVIAIDGPAAAGKGTLARRLAAHLGFAFLDTGLIYRAAGFGLLRAGGDPGDAAAAEAAARALVPADLDNPELRSEAAGGLASAVAAIPGVRAALLDFQRNFAGDPPGGRGAVLDGRDIGTVVCPTAPAKLFVTASVEVRARRRFQELLERDAGAIYERVLQDMMDRDARDSQRQTAPLVPADDALVLDTTNLGADAAFEAGLAYVATKIAPGRTG